MSSHVTTDPASLHVEPITRNSYRDAAQVLARAFVNEPVSVVIFRNFSPERRIRALTVDFTAELSVCMRRGKPIQLVQGEQIAAAAAIYPPGSYPLPSWEAWMLLLKSIYGNGFYDLRSWVSWLDTVDKSRPTDPHYYVANIGVEPALQGRAMGSMLLRHLFIQADRDQVGCYLESSDARNVPFYRRLGFQIMGIQEIIGLTAYFLWRSPGSNTSS